MRVCSSCNFNETYRNQWYKYEEKWICKKCYSKLITNPKWHPITHSKRIMWTPFGKQIPLKENPRKGVCSLCHRKIGEGVKKTAIHHIQYHDNDPLKDTIELCVSCHMKGHKLGMC